MRAQDLLTVDFGAPLHSVVLVSETDVVEKAMLQHYRLSASTPRINHEEPSHAAVADLMDDAETEIKA